MSFDFRRLIRECDWFNVCAAAGLSLGVGLLLAITAKMICQDGVFYIEIAQAMEKDFSAGFKMFWPGYPFLVLMFHRLGMVLGGSDNIYSWILAGQMVSVFCRVGAFVGLYYVGKAIVGRANSFWGLVILVFLPYPAEFGSSIIRDWCHLMFVVWGVAFVIYGCKGRRWWFFVLAGLSGFAGHTVRPEGAQVVIYGGVWLIVAILSGRLGLGKRRAMVYLALLVVSFGVMEGFFMKARGEVVPKKLQKLFSVECEVEAERLGVSRAGLCGGAWVKGAGELFEQLSVNLMYFYVLPLVVGLWIRLRRVGRAIFGYDFLIVMVLVLYVVMMFLLYDGYGYITRRHCMPMVVFSVFYVPVGMRIIARWFSERSGKGGELRLGERRRWFFVLLGVGMVLCFGKFGRIVPLRWEKQGYLEVASWLGENVGEGEFVAAQTLARRLGYYSQRQVMGFESETFVEQANYFVLVGDELAEEIAGVSMSEVFSVRANERDGDMVRIYKRN